MYYVRIMYCEYMYVFIYLLIYRDMCSCTYIRRVNVTGRHILSHFELRIGIPLSRAHTQLNFSSIARFVAIVTQKDVIFLK